jgi:hypothetical protein
MGTVSWRAEAKVPSAVSWLAPVISRVVASTATAIDM